MSKGDWIQTFTGQIFYPLDPNPGQIDIKDIAHALALTCRFGGHCKRFYSVAQHSVLVADNVTPENALWALLHDAAEAYLGDLVRPVKRFMPDFKVAEHALLNAIAKRFDLPREIPDEIHEVDEMMLYMEARDLMFDVSTWENRPSHVLANYEIFPWPWERAEAQFLMRATQLLSRHETALKGEKTNG